MIATRPGTWASTRMPSRHKLRTSPQGGVPTAAPPGSFSAVRRRGRPTAPVVRRSMSTCCSSCGSCASTGSRPGTAGRTSRCRTLLGKYPCGLPAEQKGLVPSLLMCQLLHLRQDADPARRRRRVQQRLAQGPRKPAVPPPAPIGPQDLDFARPACCPIVPTDRQQGDVGRQTVCRQVAVSGIQDEADA